MISCKLAFNFWCIDSFSSTCVITKAKQLETVIEAPLNKLIASSTRRAGSFIPGGRVLSLKNLWKIVGSCPSEIASASPLWILLI